MKNIIIILLICLLVGCLNIAPDEHWDSDDTRIWVNEASRLDLDPFWFKEDTTSLQYTLLLYKQEFEENIIKQIENSAYFNQVSRTDSVSRDMLKGIWGYTKYGYEFYQFQGNQYPMSIFIDTNKNTIKLQHKN